MKKTVLGVTAALVVAGGATAVVAQTPPPTVVVTIHPTEMTVVGESGLSVGPTRLRVDVPGKAERAFVLFELKRGVTREEAERAAPEIEHPAAAERLGRFVASSVVGGGDSYTTTVSLRDGQYVLIDLTRRPVVRAGFTVGTSPNLATAPVPDARVTMRDYAFGGDTTLPRNGIVRLQNTGRRIHHALAFRLRPGVNGRRVARRLRQGGEPRRAFAAPPTALVEVVSGGTINDVETSQRAGRYVLVCFISNRRRAKPHAELGMVRLVRFR